MFSLHFTLLLLSVVIPLTLVSAYPCGPPTTACIDMFPSGHDFHNATNTAAPYKLTASATSFAFGQNITLTLNVTGNADYTAYKGMFVQARKTSNCNTTTPIGTFSIPNNDNFLQQMSCSGGSNNAVSQKINNPQTLKTFTWTAPSTGVTGHIFFRATVVFNEDVFWTNVFTGVIRDLNDTTAAPATVSCQAQTINTLSPTATSPAPTPCASVTSTPGPGSLTTPGPGSLTTTPTGSASSMAAAVSLLFAAFVIFNTTL